MINFEKKFKIFLFFHFIQLQLFQYIKGSKLYMRTLQNFITLNNDSETIININILGE